MTPPTHTPSLWVHPRICSRPGIVCRSSMNCEKTTVLNRKDEGGAAADVNVRPRGIFAAAVHPYSERAFARSRSRPSLMSDCCACHLPLCMPLYVVRFEMISFPLTPWPKGASPPAACASMSFTDVPTCTVRMKISDIDSLALTCSDFVAHSGSPTLYTAKPQIE